MTPGSGSGAAARGTAVPGPGPGVVVALASLALVTAACGAASRPVAGPDATAVPRPASSPAPTASGTRPGVTPTPARVPSTAAATRAPSATATPSRAVPSDLPSSAPMTVRLAAGCVTPGGTQRVVVDTLPEAYIAYDNLYADGRDGAVHGGIDGRARGDAHGHFESSWVVAPGAPLGDVRLDIGASAGNRSTVRMLFYRLASSCP